MGAVNSALIPGQWYSGKRIQQGSPWKPSHTAGLGVDEDVSMLSPVESLSCKGSGIGRRGWPRAGQAEHEFQASFLNSRSMCLAGWGHLVETLYTSTSDPKSPHSVPNVLLGKWLQQSSAAQARVLDAILESSLSSPQPVIHKKACQFVLTYL